MSNEEDIKEFLFKTAYSLALTAAAEESFKSEQPGGHLGLSDIHINSPKYSAASDAPRQSLTYSFVLEDSNRENPKAIDVQLQVKVIATATRANLDTHPLGKKTENERDN